MKRVIVPDAAGKSLKIALLTDWDLLYCLPYTLLSFVYVTARRVAFAVVSKPVMLTGYLLTKLNVSFAAALVAFPLVIAGASWVTTVSGPFSAADLACALLVFMLGGALLAKVFIHHDHIQETFRQRTQPGAPVSSREAAALKRIKAEAAALPDSSVRNRLDKAILYAGFLKTLLVFPSFVCVIFLPASYLHFALLAYVASFMFNDFEWIEHVSSHAAHGHLLKPAHAPWWARLAEMLRRYVVWPLFGWFPNWYFLSHTLHHHVENDAPADWQSAVRYDRSSFFGFAKLVTWVGINLLVPIETLCYFVQRRAWRFVRMLLQGYCFYVLLLAFTAATEPVLFAILLAQRMLAGIGGYEFICIWHGFHDVNQAHDVESANHSLLHYAHHAKPGVHLLEGLVLARVARQLRKPSTLVALRPEFSFGGAPGFWWLQGLLWKKEFELAGDCFIAHDGLTKADRTDFFALRGGLTGRGIGAQAMRQRTVGLLAESRPRWLQRADEAASNLVGTLVMRASTPADRSSSPVSPEKVQ
jgi:hypothetical protein